jgi:hypothetical protein
MEGSPVKKSIKAGLAVGAALTLSLAVALPAQAATRHHPHHPKPKVHLVSWTATVDIQVVAADAPPNYHVGTQDTLRIVYDANKVNKKTGDVQIAGLQHYINGAYSDPNGEPASNQSIFNVNTKKLDFQRAVVHGTPIVIIFTPAGWQSIMDQTDGHQIIGGPYTFAASGPTWCNAKTWYANGTC